MFIAPSFNALLHVATRDEAEMIPECTTDRTPGDIFSRPFIDDKLDWVKQRLREHIGRIAAGIDQVTYQDILSTPNDALASLCNTYRLIGLESCILKVATLLIDRRFREWAEGEKVIPASQNGFRPAYRNKANAFILRTAIEKARASGETLHVVFMDLSNAFPSTDQPLLWLKLLRRGATGPMSD
ncbi:uncharacterized protein SCHCODRAFT_02491516 [Schizophyllum commune H4-8]|nr:uncharacterized protein SCHCODRAFT_02491516 [Schizophyllum commune H4-8]KAI5895923.1 hypothetical protein SCHCODRAFT_02491516 [Schizophyllum commune H4-8]